MSAAAIVAQLRASRLHWVEVEPGVSIQIDTPSWVTAYRLAHAQAEGSDDAITIVAGLVRDWRGITGEMVQGVGVGGSDPLPVSAELAALVLADRIAWSVKLGQAATNQSQAAIQRAQAASGNSLPSSTGA